MVISPGLIEKMEATIEAELVEEDEGKIYTAADLFRLPVSEDDEDDCDDLDDEDDDDDDNDDDGGGGWGQDIHCG